MLHLHHRQHHAWSGVLSRLVGLLILVCLSQAGLASPAAGEKELLQLGPGDALRLVVHGQPDLGATLYVSNAGQISVPLAGPVQVAGLSPSAAAKRVAAALRAGEYLVNPQVSLILEEFRSQRISVLGEVHNPGRYPLESRTSVLDALAEAGGRTEAAAYTIYILRPVKDGVRRMPLDLLGLTDENNQVQALQLQGGDTVFVPESDTFYIHGEVNSANRYRLEPEMTVMQAISRGGGLTPRGSLNRIRIERRTSNGRLHVRDAKLADLVRPDDVIHVRQRLF